MSIGYDVKESLVITKEMKETQAIKEMMVLRLKSILGDEETHVLKVLFNDIDYTTNWKEVIQQVMEAANFKLELTYTYMWRISKNKLDSEYSDEIFSMSQKFEKLSDEVLKSHQYTIYNYADCDADDAGVLATYKK